MVSLQYARVKNLSFAARKLRWWCVSNALATPKCTDAHSPQTSSIDIVCSSISRHCIRNKLNWLRFFLLFFALDLVHRDQNERSTWIGAMHNGNCNAINHKVINWLNLIICSGGGGAASTMTNDDNDVWIQFISSIYACSHCVMSAECRPSSSTSRYSNGIFAQTHTRTAVFTAVSIAAVPLCVPFYECWFSIHCFTGELVLFLYIRMNGMVNNVAIVPHIHASTSSQWAKYNNDTLVPQFRWTHSRPSQHPPLAAELQQSNVYNVWWAICDRRRIRSV